MVGKSPMKMLHPNPKVSFRLLDDEQILVHLGTGFVFALQGVGVRVWELLENGAAADSLVDTLLSEYAVEQGRLARDVDTLLGELKEHDLLVEES